MFWRFVVVSKNRHVLKSFNFFIYPFPYEWDSLNLFFKENLKDLEVIK